MNTLFKTITNTNSLDPVGQDQSREPAPYTKIIIRDMKLDMLIGIHEHEKNKKQAVIVNLEATIEEQSGWQDDNHDNVVCYGEIVSAIQTIAERGHINLVETYAEHIAAFCLQNNAVSTVKVSVEKPDIFDFTRSVGVEIFRTGNKN